MGFDSCEHVGALAGEDPALMGRVRRVWARPRAAVPEDPLLHAVVMALYSDTRTGMTAMGSIDRDPAERASSLNHAMCFHGPLPPEWMLVTWSPVMTTRRLSLIEGSFHTPDGARCATFVQELLMRATAPASAEGRGRLDDGR